MGTISFQGNKWNLWVCTRPYQSWAVITWVFLIVSFQIYCRNLLVWPSSLSQGVGEEMCQILRRGSSQDSILLQQREFLDVGSPWWVMTVKAPNDEGLNIYQTWRTILTCNHFGSCLYPQTWNDSNQNKLVSITKALGWIGSSWMARGKGRFLPVTLVWIMAGESNSSQM